MQDVDLGSQLYTYDVAVSLFCESFGFFVCKQRKETVLSKMGICLREEPDGRASEWQETKAAPGTQQPEPAAFHLRMLP